MKCSDPKCPSHEDDNPSFIIENVMVDSDKTNQLPLEERDAEDFKCIYCDSKCEE